VSVHIQGIRKIRQNRFSRFSRAKEHNDRSRSMHAEREADALTASGSQYIASLYFHILLSFLSDQPHHSAVSIRSAALFSE
jgi:hypothetical protein